MTTNPIDDDQMEDDVGGSLNVEPNGAIRGPNNLNHANLREASTDDMADDESQQDRIWVGFQSTLVYRPVFYAGPCCDN